MQPCDLDLLTPKSGLRVVCDVRNLIVNIRLSGSFRSSVSGKRDAMHRFGALREGKQHKYDAQQSEDVSKEITETIDAVAAAGYAKIVCKLTIFNLPMTTSYITAVRIL